MNKPKYEDIYESGDPDKYIEMYLEDGVIDTRYVAGYNNYSEKRVRKLLSGYFPDKERPDYDFVLLSALTVLDCGCTAIQAMDYAAKQLGKDSEYTERMKHETVYKMRDIVKELVKHPYKKLMQKQSQWNGMDYKKKTTTSGLTTKLHKDRKTTDALLDHERRIRQLEIQVNMQSKINSKVFSKDGRRELALSLKSEGCTIKEISDSLGVSESTTKRILNGHK